MDPSQQQISHETVDMWNHQLIPCENIFALQAHKTLPVSEETTCKNKPVSIPILIGSGTAPGRRVQLADIFFSTI
jgi:hypothetical protein